MDDDMPFPAMLMAVMKECKPRSCRCDDDSEEVPFTVNTFSFSLKLTPRAVVEPFRHNKAMHLNFAKNSCEALAPTAVSVPKIQLEFWKP